MIHNVYTSSGSGMFERTVPPVVRPASSPPSAFLSSADVVRSAAVTATLVFASKPSLVCALNQFDLAMQVDPAQASMAGQEALTDGDDSASQTHVVLSARWGAVLLPLAMAARLDARPRVADAAAAVLFGVLRVHGPGFSPALWEVGQIVEKSPRPPIRPCNEKLQQIKCKRDLCSDDHALLLVVVFS